MIHVSDLPQQKKALLLDMELACRYCRSRSDLISVFDLLGRVIPFNCWVTVMGQVVDTRLSNSIYFSTQPKHWQAEYLSRSYKQFDPIVQKVLEPEPPQDRLRWSEVFLGLKTAPVSETQKKQLGFAQRVASFEEMSDGLAMGFQRPGFSQTLIWSILGPKVEYNVTTDSVMKFVAPALLGAMENIQAISNRRILTDNDSKILTLMQQGLTAAQAAESQGVSEKTIKAQLQTIYDKLDAHNLPNAVARALSAGLIKHL
ncbi:MAG: hypothetical protein A2508_04945 [Candidatus Lambdaproteobacteria bacterium RIFOXYD12_FULL_49_8]|nr:MAG: hypothetical protein A2508_04945 [Candidatus Lambdaproteobacteria bacterium RIFOXYD12_FULL_49_8]